MAFERYPHSATLTWLTTGGVYNDTTGIYTPSTASTVIALTGRVIPNVGTNNVKYIVSSDGDKIEYDFDFHSPVLSYVDDIPEGIAELQYSGTKYRILQVPPLQKHTILRCVKL